MNFDLELSTQVLTRTPGALHALLHGLPDPWTRGVEGPDTFSPFDVVGHLIDGEETDWVPRARIILAGGPNPLFEPYDRFRHRSRNVGRTLSSLLDEFGQLRKNNFAELRSWDLTPAALDLPGIHPSWVPSRSGSSWLLGRARLDTSPRSPGHGQQLRAEVGPWEPFCRCHGP